jgi:hypothetical protein
MMTTLRLKLGGVTGAAYDAGTLNDFVALYRQLHGGFVTDADAKALVDLARPDTRAQAILADWLEQDPSSFLPSAQTTILAFLDKNGVADGSSPLAHTRRELDGQLRRQRLLSHLQQNAMAYTTDDAKMMVDIAGNDVPAQAILAVGLEKNRSAFLGNSAKTVQSHLATQGLTNPQSPLSTMVRELMARNFDPVPGLSWSKVGKG